MNNFYLILIATLSTVYFIGWIAPAIAAIFLAYDLAYRFLSPKPAEASDDLKREVAELKEKVNGELIRRALGHK